MLNLHTVTYISTVYGICLQFGNLTTRVSFSFKKPCMFLVTTAKVKIYKLLFLLSIYVYFVLIFILIYKIVILICIAIIYNLPYKLFLIS